MSTLSSAALYDRLATASGTPRARVREIMDALALLLAAEIANGTSVRLHPDIGIVRAVDRCARSGTGPDGKPWVRPAYRAARLKPSNSLKRAIREAGRQLEGAS